MSARPLTPAEQVALDAMKFAWGDEVTARMLESERFAWVLQLHRAYEGETLLGVFATEVGARASASAQHATFGYDHQELAFHEQRGSMNPFWIANSGGGELWITKEPLQAHSQFEEPNTEVKR